VFVSRFLRRKNAINLLFQTQGTLLPDSEPFPLIPHSDDSNLTCLIIETSKGLCTTYVLTITSRILFALNILLAIQNATSLKRVVSVFAAGFEGPFDDTFSLDYIIKKPFKSRLHMSSMITLANNNLSRKAPDVSFVHNHPGFVKTPFGKDAKGILAVARVVIGFISNVTATWVPPKVCGAMQLFNATSARFPPVMGDSVGVPFEKDSTVSKGTDGKPGTGSHSLGTESESSSQEVCDHLAEAKASGAEDRM
jgi:hypothetical protein